MCSGTNPAPPAFYEDWWEQGAAVHIFPSNEMWSKLHDLAPICEVDPVDVDDKSGRSTLSIFSMIHKAPEDRKRILEVLFQIRFISRAQINRRLVKDDIKIAEMLQQLFKRNAYLKEIPTLPQEHAVSVLNLTHYILDRSVPATDCRKFSRHAYRLLNWLASYLNLLPDEIAIGGVTLLTVHPVKHGGFANIYHGRYKNLDGEYVEVALKVLRIFEDQSDEERLLLHSKFTKEALVWHSLKHKNIVPFLGVDSTTFPSPARAMASPWMPLGSVLKYMTENPPSSMYAIELVRQELHPRWFSAMDGARVTSAEKRVQIARRRKELRVGSRRLKRWWDAGRIEVIELLDVKTRINLACVKLSHEHRGLYVLGSLPVSVNSSLTPSLGNQCVPVPISGPRSNIHEPVVGRADDAVAFLLPNACPQCKPRTAPASGPIHRSLVWIPRLPGEHKGPGEIWELQLSLTPAIYCSPVFKSFAPTMKNRSFRGFTDAGKRLLEPREFLSGTFV
ncbi:hypothetical protein B0H10DRAFT_1967479 [Mycena sp. CBHHK59/15]|nr:hypothetical protein B0H10DRAFT_1967479 [Mycena sp. CBHHK59/15]